MKELDEIIQELIPKSMKRTGLTTLQSILKSVTDIINRRQFPENGFSELQVTWLLKILSSMDSDKDPKAYRVGEREGRVVSGLLEELSAGFNHGIGRSGQIAAPQPKAVGASLMQEIANTVATSAIKRLGIPNVKAGLVLPLSTGMAIGLVLAALRKSHGISRVLHPRIDHRSPSRGIALTGLDEIVLPTMLEDDAVIADMNSIEQEISRYDQQAMLATTTFFAPREGDPIKEISKLCAEYDVPLVINNAYGVQSADIMKSIASSIDAGRVDAVVQSSDKNFMVPVGGSLVVSCSETTIANTAESYAGRASAAPVVQTLAGMLLLGLNGYENLRKEQQENRKLLEIILTRTAQEFGERVLEVVNPVSCAMTLDRINAKELGARLYHRRVTGPRVVGRGDWGASIDKYPHDYLVVNSAIGARKKDIEGATTKIYKELEELSSLNK